MSGEYRIGGRGDGLVPSFYFMLKKIFIFIKLIIMHVNVCCIKINNYWSEKNDTRVVVALFIWSFWVVKRLRMDFKIES